MVAIARSGAELDELEGEAAERGRGDSGAKGVREHPGFGVRAGEAALAGETGGLGEGHADTAGGDGQEGRRAASDGALRASRREQFDDGRAGSVLADDDVGGGDFADRLEAEKGGCAAGSFEVGDEHGDVVDGGKGEGVGEAADGAGAFEAGVRGFGVLDESDGTGEGREADDGRTGDRAAIIGADTGDIDLCGSREGFERGIEVGDAESERGDASPGCGGIAVVGARGREEVGLFDGEEFDEGEVFGAAADEGGAVGGAEAGVGGARGEGKAELFERGSGCGEVGDGEDEVIECGKHCGNGTGGGVAR